MNSFTTVIYTFKVSKHIIIGQSMNINVFSWLLSFFKLRESGIQSLGIKEKWPQSTYLIFRRGSTGESFFFHGLIDFILFFYTGLKDLGSFLSQVLFCFQPRILAMVRLPAMDPAQKLIFLSFTSAEGKGVPTSVLGSQPTIWLLSLSPSGVRRPEVTKYQHLFIPSVTYILP